MGEKGEREGGRVKEKEQVGKRESAPVPAKVRLRAKEIHRCIHILHSTQILAHYKINVCVYICMYVYTWCVCICACMCV
jgi:hypothetical protein